jgi:hypothetical protein
LALIARAAYAETAKKDSLRQKRNSSRKFVLMQAGKNENLGSGYSAPKNEV